MRSRLLPKLNNIDNIKALLPLIIILSIPFSNFYIDVGFAIKPYMVTSGLSIVLYYKEIIGYFNDNNMMKIFKEMNRFEQIFLFFSVSYMLTIFIAKYKMVSLRLIFGIIIFIVSYFMFKKVLYSLSYRKLSRYLYIVGIIFNVSSFILYILGLVYVGFNFKGNQFSVFGLMLDRNMPRLIGVLSDPNFFVFYNLIFIFTFLDSLKIKFGKLWFTLALMNTFLTISRSGFIALTISLIIYAILRFNKFKTIDLKLNYKKVVALTVVVTTITIIFFVIIDFNPFKVLIDRFFVKDGASGRFKLISNGLFMLKESRYLGIGIFNFRPLNIELFNMSHYMHNTFVEVLVEGGFIVFALFILSLVTLIVYALKIYRTDSSFASLLSVLLGSVVMMLTLSMLINEMLLLVFLLISINYDKSKSKGKNSAMINATK